MGDDRRILDYAESERPPHGRVVLHIIGAVLCCIMFTYGVLFVVGASHDLWLIRYGNVPRKPDDVRANIGRILVGLVLIAASCRWVTPIVRRYVRK